MNSAGGWDSVLFSSFRERSNQPETKRVERILDLMVTAQTYLAELHRILGRSEQSRTASEFLDSNRRRIELEHGYYKTLEELQSGLRRYRWRSSVQGDLDGFREEIEWDMEATKHTWAHWEYAIVRLLLKQTKEPGAIGRFRKCSDCHQWFYATNSHQNFCKDACRRRHTAQNPGFKEKRRIYMKQRYRPQQRELQRLSLEIAKGKRSRNQKGAK